MKRNFNKMKKSYDTQGKKTRELTLTVSVFLLGREEVKGLFWNILNTHYEHQNNVINIGISTIEGKLGTTLQKLRKTAKYLSQYLLCAHRRQRTCQNRASFRHYSYTSI
jgi:hypothetical protein